MAEGDGREAMRPACKPVQVAEGFARDGVAIAAGEELATALVVGEVGVDRVCVKGAAAVDDEADGARRRFVYGLFRAGRAGGVGVDE